MSTKRRIRQTVLGERRIPGGREVRITHRLEDGPAVPAVLLLPETTSPAPGALLLHGYASRKEAMAGPVGTALLAEGIASLAIDLALHGARAEPAAAGGAGGFGGPGAAGALAMVKLWRRGLEDARLGVRYLSARREVDRDRLAVVGYSLGAYLALAAAADDALVRAVVLAAGGDLPAGTPLAALARTFADPVAAVRKLGDRPLLMVHGRRDRTILPEQAERLYQAAPGPKEIRWLDSGHYLPPEAGAGVATWLRGRL